MKGKSRRVKKSVRRSRRYGGFNPFAKTKSEKPEPKFKINEIVKLVDGTKFPGKYKYRVYETPYYVEKDNVNIYPVEMMREDFEKISPIPMTTTDPFSAKNVPENYLEPWFKTT